MKNPYKKISRKKIYSNNWIKVFEDKVKIDNKDTLYSFIIPNQDRGVVSVIAQDEKGFFYLVRQWRYPINQETIEFVAGGIEKNETPLQAAKRELFEELGLKSKSWKYLGKYRASTNLFLANLHIYLAQNIEIKEKNYQNIEEYTEKLKLSEKQLQKYIKSGKIEDDVTLSTYLKYLIFKNKIK